MHPGLRFLGVGGTPLLCVIPSLCSPVVSILDVEKEESSGHEHAQDGDGGQDAVKRNVDVPSLRMNKCLIFGRLHT